MPPPPPAFTILLARCSITSHPPGHIILTSCFGLQSDSPLDMQHSSFWQQLYNIVRSAIANRLDCLVYHCTLTNLAAKRRCGGTYPLLGPRVLGHVSSASLELRDYPNPARIAGRSSPILGLQKDRHTAPAVYCIATIAECSKCNADAACRTVS